MKNETIYKVIKDFPPLGNKFMVLLKTLFDIPIQVSVVVYF
jgi:hypothetical protein